MQNASAAACCFPHPVQKLGAGAVNCCAAHPAAVFCSSAICRANSRSMASRSTGTLLLLLTVKFLDLPGVHDFYHFFHALLSLLKRIIGSFMVECSNGLIVSHVGVVCGLVKACQPKQLLLRHVFQFSVLVLCAHASSKHRAGQHGQRELLQRLRFSSYESPQFKFLPQNLVLLLFCRRFLCSCDWHWLLGHRNDKLANFPD